MGESALIALPLSTLASLEEKGSTPNMKITHGINCQEVLVMPPRHLGSTKELGMPRDGANARTNIGGIFLQMRRRQPEHLAGMSLRGTINTRIDLGPSFQIMCRKQRNHLDLLKEDGITMSGLVYTISLGMLCPATSRKHCMSWVTPNTIGSNATHQCSSG